MPKAKPISLHPLSFDEAIAAIICVEPSKIQKPKVKKMNKHKKS